MPTAPSAGKSAPKPAPKPAAKADKPVDRPAAKAEAAKPVGKVAPKPEKTAPKAPAKVEKPAAKVEKPAPAAAPERPMTHAQAQAAAAALPKPSLNGKAPPPMDFDAFLAKLTPKDRLNIERHLTAIEELSTKAHAKLWKKLAAQMMTMAFHSAKANGQQSMQFYIQDGKYRMQIFALEDLRDGTVHVYMTDAMDEAMAAGVLLKAKPGDEPDQMRLPNSTDLLTVERLDGKVSNPAPFYKDMLGWNRRAVHIALPAMASDAQIAATEALLIHGARKAGALK